MHQTKNVKLVQNTVSGFPLWAVLVVVWFRLEGRTWRLSLVQDMAPSFSLCIRQPKPTATTVIILLWLTHGSASLACLSWHRSSRVSHFSLASAALSFLIYRLLNAKICFLCVKKAQGKFLHLQYYVIESVKMVTNLTGEAVGVKETAGTCPLII